MKFTKKNTKHKSHHQTLFFVSSKQKSSIFTTPYHTIYPSTLSTKTPILLYP